MLNIFKQKNISSRVNKITSLNFSNLNINKLCCLNSNTKKSFNYIEKKDISFLYKNNTCIKNLKINFRLINKNKKYFSTQDKKDDKKEEQEKEPKNEEQGNI